MSRWRIKIPWLAIQQGFICTVGLFLQQRTVRRLCSVDPPHVDFSTWLYNLLIPRADGKVITCSRSFFRISEVRAQRRQQLLRLLPLEVWRKVKNNMLQFQIFLD